MDDPRDILYDTFWQSLRVRLKQDRDIHHTLLRLQAYLAAAPTDLELYFRVYRVARWLEWFLAPRAVGEDPEAADATLFLKSLLPARKKLSARFPWESLPEWDWDAQLAHLRALRRADPTTFQALLADLSGRLVKLPRASRPGLERYLSLMRQVSNETLI